MRLARSAQRAKSIKKLEGGEPNNGVGGEDSKVARHKMVDKKVLLDPLLVGCAQLWREPGWERERERERK